MKFKSQLLNWVRRSLRNKRWLSHTKASGEREDVFFFDVCQMYSFQEIWKYPVMITLSVYSHLPAAFPVHTGCWKISFLFTSIFFFVIIQLFGISHLSSPIFYFVFVYVKLLLGWPLEITNPTFKVCPSWNLEKGCELAVMGNVWWSLIQSLNPWFSTNIYSMPS